MRCKWGTVPTWIYGLHPVSSSSPEKDMWLHGWMSNVFPEPTKPAIGVETLLTRRLATWGPVLAMFPYASHWTLLPFPSRGQLKSPDKPHAPLFWCVMSSTTSGNQPTGKGWFGIIPCCSPGTGSSTRPSPTETCFLVTTLLFWGQVHHAVWGPRETWPPSWVSTSPLPPR